MAISYPHPQAWAEALERDSTEDRLFEPEAGFSSDLPFETTRTRSTHSTTASWQSLTFDATVTSSSHVASTISFDGGVTYPLAAVGATYEIVSTTSTLASADAVDSDFDIVVNYSGDATYKAAFTAAVARWEEIITADVPDVPASQFGFIDDLVIDATIVSIDGQGGILGQAGPDTLRDTSLLPSHGIMRFDSADVADMLAAGTWTDVILHEMGHVLGIGILWDDDYLGLTNASGDYVGAHGLTEYRTLSHNPAATSVPIEHDGASGTAGTHWDEGVFDNELMTGYIEPAGTKMPISRTTIGLLDDMGYAVDYSAADRYTLPGQSPSAPPDFNGDGYSDILWQNTNGQAAIWDMNGTQILTSGFVGSNPGTSWTVVDSGDFNGDGKSGILWRHTNGQVAIWDLNGTSIVTAGTVGSNPGTSWKTIGTGDFDDDGKSDILWQHTNGQVGIWELDGTSIVKAGTVGPNPGTSWKAIGTGDFNDDGKSDILWQHTNGQVGIWELDGTSIIKAGTVGSNTGTNWTARDTGDYNGDGRSDILFQHTNGAVGIWELDGTTVIGGAGTLVGSVDPGWHVV